AKDAIDKCKPDAVLAACVLDVDVDKNIVDYSLRAALVADSAGKAGRATTARSAVTRAVAEGQETPVVVEVVKEDYLVLSLPELGNAIAFAVTKSFNDRSKPFMRFKVGQRLSGSLVRAERNRRVLVLLRSAPAAPARAGAGDGAGKRAAKDPVDPAIGFFEDFQPGLVTQARVRSIKGVQANLDLAANVKGRLHITELVDGPMDVAVSSPAETFAAAGVRAGETIRVKVLGWHDAKVYKFLPITHRTSPLKTVIETTVRPAALAEDGAPAAEALSLKTIKPGLVLNGFVKGVREQAVKGRAAVQVVLGTALIGNLLIQAATCSAEVALHPGRYFVAGTPIEVQVSAVDAERKAIHLVPHGRFIRGVAPPPESAAQLVRGARVLATVGKIQPDAMF
ncbi:rRNA biogenesis protein rrp5, partial [Coemansia spiralis]